MKIATDELHDAALDELTSEGQLLETTTIGRPWGAQAVFKNAPPNLGVYFGLLRQHSEQVFLVYREERYTFEQTWLQANALASALQNRGIKKGDRVVIAMRNYPEWVFSFIGIMLAGGVAVPLNAWWQGQELGEAIEDSGAAIAIVDEARHKRLADTNQALAQIVVRAGAVQDGATAYPDFLAKNEMPRPVDVGPDDDATIFYTSGSSSYPKGVVSTHRALTNAMFNFAAYGLAQQAVESSIASAEPSSEQAGILLSVPLFHVTGCHSIFMISVLVGRKVVMLDKWEPEAALRLIEAERITSFLGVPTMTRELAAHPKRHNYDLSSLREINAGGAPRPASHVERLQKQLPNAQPGMAYGLTETNATGAINNRQGYLARPASTGRAPKPLAELAILDDTGASLPDGSIGEIAVRAASIARGYWNRPADTAEAFMPSGWFKTGDLGFLEEGYLTIVDRKKDMILRGGENVACQEVEAAMQEDERVLEACVFGMPDDRLGESVCAVVFVENPLSFVVAAHLDFLATRLAVFKLPSAVHVAGEPLPRLGSGKVDKRSVKARVESKTLSSRQYQDSV